MKHHYLRSLFVMVGVVAIVATAAAAPKNKAGFRSLTIVRNHENLGGCGGFNTGFAFIEKYLDALERA